MGLGDKQAVLKAERLTKHFAHIQALTNVSLTVNKGEFWTLFGPNGAGKTTLIAILATLMKPNKGELFVNGKLVTEGDKEIRNEIGLVSHRSFFYGDLTGFENLVFYGKMYGIRDAKDKVKEVLDEHNLSPWTNRRTKNLSRGLEQRFAIARALLHDPNLILLDEPFAGLDRKAAIHLQNILKSLHEAGKTIIMTTHNTHLGLYACTHLAIISEGRIAYMGLRPRMTVEEFEQLYFGYVK